MGVGGGWSRLSSCSVLEEDTSVGGAVLGTDTGLALVSVGSGRSLVAGSTIGAWLASWAGRSLFTRAAGATIVTGGAVGSSGSGFTIGASGAWIASFGLGAGGRGSVGSFLAGRSGRCGWSRGSFLASWSRWSVLAGATGRSVGSIGTRGSGRAVGTWRAIRAWFARGWSGHLTNLPGRLTGESGATGSSVLSGLSVLSWPTGRAWLTGQTAIVTSGSDLPLGHGSITWHGERIEATIVQFVDDRLSRGLAEIGLLPDTFSNAGHVIVDNGQCNTHAQDGHDAERDGRVGHEFIGLLSALVLHCL